MPRFNKANTPPERRRAPKGSAIGECRFRHDADSLVHFHALKTRWGLSDTATNKRALAVAVACTCSHEEVKP
jgi:hypothetical protein